MAKYAYAPLSVEDGVGRRRNSNQSRFAQQQMDDEESDRVVNERMPMCVGVCVLMAIVYVLSRSGAAQSQSSNGNGGNPLPADPNVSNNNSASKSAAVNTVVLDDHATSTASSASASFDYSKCPEADCPKCPSTSTSSAGTFSTSSSSSSSSSNCDGLVDPSTVDMGALRAHALASTPPHIIECSAANDGEDQSACHLPAETRYAALGQKGATLWMTGCSGAGKTTIATALEDRLVKEYGKHVYRLDGDNLRTGINRDLSFSEADRAESVRRTGEIATLFADSGVITLVGLISPYRSDRDEARKRHEDQGIPFYEIFLDVPVEELKKRDPKGQYARVESGELKHFTCIDDPYEEPLSPELTLKTHELAIEESADLLFQMLEKDGVLIGAPKLTPPGVGLPNPDGDEIIDLHVPAHLKVERTIEASTLPKVLITDMDLNWLQVIGEGWASPLKGFMREGTLLETLHFNSILVDPFNVTGNANRHERQTNFETFTDHQPPQRVSMSVPITLSATSFTVDSITESKKRDVALVTQMGETVAILRDVEVYANRKEEIVTRMFGAIDMDHAIRTFHTFTPVEIIY